MTFALLTSGMAMTTALGQTSVRFNRDIRPLLSDNCFLCHGPDSARRKAGLRLDTEDGLFGKRDDGPAIVKGDAAKSPVYQRIVTDDSHEIMPPPKSNKKLTAAQKDLIKAWIQQGAPFEPHWSFAKPTASLPAVKNQAWVRNPIDAFILAKLESVGLTPAAEADRRTLIRRVTFDLTGLPPSPAEVQAFVEDKTLDAYEKLVDRLLASEQYGEHRARYWLDAARYGDTHGLHFDNHREMWPYRDWVIRAFNKNLPFDKFTVEQLAGDLLPNPTTDQLVASGFHRCNITTNEGGSINEEVLVSYARDRVETTATVWLGLTAGCCSCHNHKFDPLTQKEFYQLAAFFRNTTQNAMDGNIPNTPPTIPVPIGADAKLYEEFNVRLSKVKAEIEARRKELTPAFDKWRTSPDSATIDGPIDLKSLSLVAADHKKLEGPLPKGITQVDGPVPETKGWKFDEAGFEMARVSSDGGMASDLTISGWIFVPGDGELTVVRLSDPGPSRRALQFGLANRAVFARFTGADPKKDFHNVSTGKTLLDKGKWSHVVFTTGRSGDPASKTAEVSPSIFINGKRVENLIHQRSGVVDESAAALGNATIAPKFNAGAVADLRIYNRRVQSEQALSLFNWLALSRDLFREPTKLDPKQIPSLKTLYLNRLDDRYPTLVAEQEVLERQIKQIIQRSPATHVMQERPDSMPMAKVLNRGQYDQPKEDVKAGVFAVLNPLPKDAPGNRLGLAQWIVSPDNPLTARVAVNRFWQEVFGIGLVRTTEDFGAQGEAPSHPELLDWLAIDFQTHGWDVKRLMKMLVTSNAYRQAAIVTPEKREKDAANRLLSRGPRFRMDAEMIRDQALAASGLLVQKIGGPSVKPYQPEGVWEAVGILGASNTRDYRHDKGDGLYRRSMYWYWKRMSPPPSMEIFNAPSRETCTVRRERTNTPLQALVTMNDPQFVEAARHLAQSALLAKDQTDADRLDGISLKLMARPFRDEERKIVLASLARFTEFYRAQPKEAARLIAVGESQADASLDPTTLAAWTMLANQLMNLDEVLTK
jgi:hypothetical protein